MHPIGLCAHEGRQLATSLTVDFDSRISKVWWAGAKIGLLSDAELFGWSRGVPQQVPVIGELSLQRSSGA
jgi:hypothetical protein